jgi:predicted dehydrogenase
MTRLLIIGTGSMAHQHAESFGGIEGVQVVAAVEPLAERLAAFADRHAIEHRFGDLDKAIAWGGFDAVSNVTPDAVHYPTTMKVLAAGKHVLCEKPLATNYPLAMEMTEAAEKRGVINMVNLSYRASPALQRAREMVVGGEIGEIRHFDASYLQSWLTAKYWGDWRSGDTWLWRLSSAHGSRGVIGDIGIHLVDFATYATANDIVWMESRAKTFHKVEGDRIGDYVLDANDSFAMTVELRNGALGVIHASRWATGNFNELRLAMYGTLGGLRVHTNGPDSSLHVCMGEDIETQTWREIECPPVRNVYQRFAESVRTGIHGSPDFRRAARIQRILDLCLEAGDRAHGGVRVE